MCYAPDNVIERRNIKSKLLWIPITISIAIAFYIIYNGHQFIESYKPELALAYVSISLAIAGMIYSIKTSYDSNSKMIQIANVNFLQALDDSIESRIRYIGKPNHSNDSFSWLLQTHFERAYELDRKMIKKKYHHRLIHSFIKSLDEFFNRVEWDNLKTGIQGNIHRVYEIAHHYVRKDKKQEDEFIEILEKMDKKKEETEEDFYKKLFPPEQTKT